SARRFVAGRVPRVGQPPVRFDHEDLAVDDTVPSGYGLGAEVERVADDWLEVVLHQPFLEQRAWREDAPDLLRWMRHLSFDDDGAGGEGGFGHWSIPFSRVSRRSKRSRQKVP